MAVAASAARAEEPKLFAPPPPIDTRFMHRLAGQDLPTPMWLPALAVSPALPTWRAERPLDEFAPARAAAADKDVVLTTGIEEAGAIATQAAVLHQGFGDSHVWAAARHDHQMPYRDGADERVNSGYDRMNVQAALSHRPTQTSRISAFAMRDVLSEVRLANYGLDVPGYTRWTGTGSVESRPAGGAFDKVEAGASINAMSYAADNFSLRDIKALGLEQKGDWMAYRGVARGEFAAGGLSHVVAVDANLQTYDARVYNRFSSNGLSSFRLPKVSIARTGLALLSSAKPTGSARLSGGLRLDLAHSNAAAANETPTVTGAGASAYTITPQRLWTSYYGNVANDPSDAMISGKLRWDQALSAETGLYGEASRMVRLPEAAERFMASGGPASITQAGNPGLSPEAHHRVEIGAEAKLGGWRGHLAPQSPPGSLRLVASVWHDRISDFITADRARGQAGIAKSDYAVIYRNVDAAMTGASLAGWWQIAEGWGARLSLSWTEGSNLSDDRPLYQVQPLEGEAALEHRRLLWDSAQGSVGLRLGFAGTQNRVDSSTLTGLGQDTAGRTPGYAVLDLYSGLLIDNRLALAAGVYNVLDKRYHTHLNPFPQSATTLAQRAPGRSLFGTLTLAF